MKKISFILIICIVLASLHNIVPAAGNAYVDTIKVGISYGSSASKEAWFYSDSPVDIVDASSYSYITTVPAQTKFCVTASESLLTSEYFSPVMMSIRLDSASVISYNGENYRGSFELNNAGDKVTVINVVNTEDYLASVLGKEMSSSWPIEALKAQAVCARNYAITNLNKHSSYGFDLCATQDCQVYGGMASEADRTRQAVAETQGVLVKYQGRVVPLFYFSCDGGYTENSENVWVSAEGYLRGKKDIYENPKYATYYNWSQSYTKEEIENILETKKMSVGELLDIRIDRLSENNGVIELTFVGTEGEKRVTKTQTRTVLSLKSQTYTIEKHAAQPTVSEETEQVTQWVLSADGVVSVNNPVYALTSGGIMPIHYETVTKETEAQGYESYTFNGHGWGHLVGMSQWGAYSMAKEGFSYKDILNFYFTDIVIVENEYTVSKDEPVEKNEATAEETAEETEDENSNTNDGIQWSDTGI